MGLFRSERGIALIVALLVITILFVLVIEFNYLTRVDVTIAANIRDENKALYVAKAGVNAAIALLKRDSNNYDAPSEDWGSFASLPHSEYLGEGSVAGSITDESGKININRIVDANSKSLQQLKRLFALLEIDENLIDSISDWVDSDDNVRPMGAEDDYYRGLENPYPCKDGPLDTISELLMVKGITEDQFFGTKDRKGIREFLTVHSDGKININSADRIVLQTVCYPVVDEWKFPISEEMAESIISYREMEAFKDIADLKKIPEVSDVYEQIKDQITVQSRSFSVDVVGTVNMAEKRVTAIIIREKSGAERVMKIAYWTVE